jgi:molecular chaperone DnaK
VTAKDRGTGKEQKITISGGSALSKEEIERMVKDAEAHADEDKKRREETETRNMAESLVFSTEKFLSESGDKLTDEQRSPVDTALADLKDAIKPESTLSRDEIQAKIDHLNEESQKMGAAMYAAAAEQGESGDVPGGEASDGAEQGTANDGGSDEDVVDAEVVEDDEEKK